MNNCKDIYIYVEQRNGIIQEVSYELIGEAKRLAEQIKTYQVVAVLLGYNIKNLQVLIEYGADKVIVCKHELLQNYHTESYTKALDLIIKTYQPDFFLIGATTIGRDLAPRVAARCNTGLTADATLLEVDLTKDSPLLLVTRPAFGGNLFASITCDHHRPQMASIRPKVFAPLAPDTSRKGEIIDFNVELSKNDIHTETIKTIQKVQKGIDITKAEIIISGGRGVAKNFDILKTVAKELDAAVGASRAVVDEGYVSKEIQVGQTGVTVRPRIYIACGISGAVQHAAGMDKSDYIIAINKDPNAAIFNIAHVGIIGDALEILPLIKEEILKIKHSS
mgnify:FL=1